MAGLEASGYPQNSALPPATLLPVNSRHPLSLLLLALKDP